MTPRTPTLALAAVALAIGCQSRNAPTAGADASSPQNAQSTAAPSLAAPNSVQPAASLVPPIAGRAKPPRFSGTAGIVDRPQEKPSPSALLRDVRSARHEEGYDRVVFEFAATALPGYHIEYIDRPVRKCGSGDPTAVAGDAWLEVRFSPADAHTQAGVPMIRERERTVSLEVLRELELTCDFEAVTSWVLGVASPNKYRVLELQSPPRIVVDILH